MESMGRSRARGAVPVLSVDGQLSVAPVCTARSNDFGRTSVGRSACGSTKRRGAAPRSLLASRAPGGSRARGASRGARMSHGVRFQWTRHALAARDRPRLARDRAHTGPLFRQAVTRRRAPRGVFSRVANLQTDRFVECRVFFDSPLRAFDAGPSRSRSPARLPRPARPPRGPPSAPPWWCAPSPRRRPTPPSRRRARSTTPRRARSRISR